MKECVSCMPEVIPVIKSQGLLFISGGNLVLKKQLLNKNQLKHDQTHNHAHSQTGEKGNTSVTVLGCLVTCISNLTVLHTVSGVRMLFVNPHFSRILLSRVALTADIKHNLYIQHYIFTEAIHHSAPCNNL